MHKYLLVLLCCTGLFFTACTKQESSENLRNIKGGLKNTWNNVKEGVSETSREFNEQTR